MENKLYFIGIKTSLKNLANHFGLIESFSDEKQIAYFNFWENIVFAITGAEMNAKLDGQPLKRGRAYQAGKGQILSMSMAENGVRAYIAFRGGIDVPLVMGSRSTNLKSSFGGYEGRRLMDGDILKLGEDSGCQEEISALLMKEKVQPEYSGRISVRVIPGPQDDYFPEETKEKFYGGVYKVSSDSDRMGIRLIGEKLESNEGTDIVSDGITFGSIQVTSSGQPIVLMADHQTTGGYAKIATVVSEDLPLLSQARPGDIVEFIKTDIDQLQRRGVYRWIIQWKSRIKSENLSVKGR